jgi:hypothetical protein
VVCVQENGGMFTDVDPFDTSSAGSSKPHPVGKAVFVKMNDTPLEEILVVIASQSGFNVKLSNGIVFY